MVKVILIICDGLSDRPIAELGGKTPLEAAYTPNLDKLVKKGITGLMHTVDIGVRPGSDVAHLSIFGYDPATYYPGRGPIEAAGYGLEVKKGDVAMRGNFATVNEKMVILDRRAGRIDDVKPLVKSLSNMTISGINIRVAAGTGHRAAIVFHGPMLDGRITDTDPHVENVKVLFSKPKVKSSAATKTARIVNEFSRKTYIILKDLPYNLKRIKSDLLPANILLLRGAGMLPNLPSFESRYSLRASCVAGAGLYKGIGSLLGMDVLSVAGATGKPDTDINSKISEALKSLKTHDFVFVHIKGADVLAEDGNFLAKKIFIEKIDKSLAPLVNRDDILVVVTADHTTSSVLKIHTADPVPILIAGKNLHTDSVSIFGERACGSGKLGHIQGKHLIPIILDFLGKAPLFGA